MGSPAVKNSITRYCCRLLLAGLLILSPALLPAQADEDTYTDTPVSENGNPRFLQKEDTDSLVVQERRLPPGYVQKTKSGKDFWYADTEPRKKKEKKSKSFSGDFVPFGRRPWVQVLLWILIIGSFAGAIMWYLAESNVGLFKKKKMADGDAGSEGEDMPEDIFTINYQKEIDQAVAQGNYRTAVRLMFLRLLKNLSDKNIIQYQQDKTNLDYLLHLSSTNYYSSFFRLSRHFEYSWYGKFDVPADAYRVIATEFNQFEKQIQSA